MRGVRALLCPLRSPGFAFPVVAIGRALAARRGQVTWAGDGGLAGLLPAEGIAVRGLRAGREVAFATAHWHAPGAIADQVAALDAAIDDEAPDVLVTSALALGPLLVGRRRGLPVAVVGTLSDLFAPGPRADQLAAALTRACEHLGVATLPTRALRGDLYLRRGVPGLVEDEHLIGDCRWAPPPSPVLLDWLAARAEAGHRVLAVHQARSFGSPGLWPALLAAVTDGLLPADMRLAACTLRMDQPTRTAPAEALVSPHLSFDALLPAATALLCSGTSAVVSSALRHGCPLLVVPGGGEQFDLAELVVAAGVGLSLPATDLAGPALAGALGELMAMDPAPRRDLATRFAAVDGPERAARWIEAL
ncbi:MAG: hypothetical protein H6742_07840 [Alphaproteobacteria bacterium]|nr:hypothetical protein [Alphaproteobacteria bacterium]